MPAVLSPPVVSQVPIAASMSAAPVDAAFEQRWNTWRDRGIQNEIAARRTARLAAIVAALLAASVYVVFRLVGGGL